MVRDSFPIAAEDQFDRGGRRYHVTARWLPEGETHAVDTKGRAINWDEDDACLLTVTDDTGFIRDARVVLQGVTRAALASVKAHDRNAVLRYYLEQAPTLLDMPAGKSWPGLLKTPEGHWLHHRFPHEPAYERILALKGAPDGTVGAR